MEYTGGRRHISHIYSNQMPQIGAEMERWRGTSIKAKVNDESAYTRHICFAGCYRRYGEMK